MSIFDDFFDGEVFQLHVSVLGRNSTFLGVAGRSVVVAVHIQLYKAIVTYGFASCIRFEVHGLHKVCSPLQERKSRQI